MTSANIAPSWLERPIFRFPQKAFTIENLLIVLIMILAILSRFVMLGERVMSHDEVNHVVPSYDLYQGKTYVHSPVTHGPFQFHVVALSYFLFGDSDFSSRIPAALFSVAAVGFVLFAFRRYLGRSGALVAGLLFLISPFLMYYGRYTRNEAFIELIGVATLYGILRYLEKGDRASMFVVTVSTVMHFIVKETAFIYTAQALIFLFFMFMLEARRAEVKRPERYNRFLLLMSLAMLLVIVALGLAVIKADQSPALADGQSAAQQAENQADEQADEQAVATPTGSLLDSSHLRLYGEILAVVGALILGGLGLLTLAQDIGWGQMKRLRSFALLILVATLILPMLSPLPVNMLGWDALDYANTTSMLRTGAFIALFFVIAVVIGMWWNPTLWLQHAFVFYAIFIVFYTTFFTNGNGFFTGIVGSLGYWLSQQGVERGSQPRYYYALIQMPVYEFLAYLGTVVAVYFGIKYARFSTIPGFSPAHAPREAEIERLDQQEAQAETALEGSTAELPVLEAGIDEQAESDRFYRLPRALPVLGFLVYWAVTSLLAYSIAGERMPWLTVHITMPFLLVAAWGIGFLIDTTDWRQITRPNGLLAVLLFPMAFASLASFFGVLLGTNPPFQGNTLDQLQATSRFLISGLAAGASLAGIIYLLRATEGRQIARLAALTFLALMAVLTARAAYRASFINYDYATEYLVYAHAAPGPKLILKQVEELSRRTTGDKSIQVAYSSDALYPYWWYLRDYPNNRWFQSNPTRDLRDFPVIIAGDDVSGKMEAIVGDEFVMTDYVRLWWPNQDYYNLTWERVWGAVSNPDMRAAVFDIWLNRDYREYARLTGEESTLKPETWSPAARVKLYVRKDVIANIWEYGASPVTISPEEKDPFLSGMIQIQPIQVVGASGSQPGELQAPRGIKFAQDGSFYVADSRNHRIQHFAADGTVLQTWGSFADQSQGEAPGGTFYEPWDVAVGPDGSVYVSDTWNHRVQKFTADGQFIKMWGYFGQAEAPEAFWGPRGLAVDQDGRVYVMDTGNKRVVIFDADGNFLSQFGSSGFENGQFNEPVGIALDAQKNVYISDTWNQRVQVLAPSADGLFYIPLRAWDITGWVGQSLENKPLIAVSPVNGHVFITDPEFPRVLEFDSQGQYIRGWGDYSSGPDGFGLASGVAVSPDGDVWVTDGANNVILRFRLP